ncbi:hypothetical protein RN04_03400 [Arthrobacter sp. W1]|nr:hypothetical protein RN04_03400 [Arthrobacter sp. W1]
MVFFSTLTVEPFELLTLGLKGMMRCQRLLRQGVARSVIAMELLHAVLFKRKFQVVRYTGLLSRASVTLGRHRSQSWRGVVGFWVALRIGARFKVDEDPNHFDNGLP